MQKLNPQTQLTGQDIELKSPIYAEILRRLTPTGVAAFQSGALARLNDAAARESLRNPPAHSRYVTLPIARECKQYVDDVLPRLIEFTLDSFKPAPTLHQ